MWIIRVTKDYDTNKILRYTVLDESCMKCYELNPIMLKQFMRQNPDMIYNAELDLAYRPKLKDMNPEQKIKYYDREIKGNLVINHYCIVTGYSNGLINFIASAANEGTVHGNCLTIAEIKGLLMVDKVKFYNALVKEENGKTWVYIFNENRYKKLSSIVEDKCNNLLEPSWVYSINKISHNGMYLDYIKHKNGIYEATVPNGVCHIERFYGNVNKLILPITLTSLGEGAFQELSDLEELVFNKGLTIVPVNCCYDSAVNTVKFSGDEQLISEGAFEESELKGALVTNAIIICDRAFAGTKITSANLLKADDIRDYAFEYCKKLQKVTLHSGLKYIRNGAFIGCSKLTSINIPSSVKVIGARAFDGCTSLREVKVPHGVKIGNRAFPKRTIIKEY